MSSSSSALAPQPLGPSHITLLLKYHKSTVLLSVLPSTPISHVKTLLLAALTSRGIATLPSPSATISLPTDPDELQLGILVDKKDQSKGFKLLLFSEAGSAEERKNLKGKSRPSKGGDNNSGASQGEPTVEAAGLGDGSWVAYRVRAAGGGSGGVKKGEAEDEEELNVDVSMEGDPGWDVVVPSFEEMDAVEAGARGRENDIPIPDFGRVR